MAIIVNSAWKSKKTGDEVDYKGGKYTIGSDAFATVEKAVEAGSTSDLVIVDKKLTSPVKGTPITGAATDIFESTVKEDESKDHKTLTKTVKFSAAAGGTATMKNDAALNGFDKVAVTNAGGAFFGGKQEASLSAKLFNDNDKNSASSDITATYSTTATGSLDVNNKETAAVIVGGIADEADGSQQVIDELALTYMETTGDEDFHLPAAASYANVTLKNVESESAFNGGSATVKSTVKFSETNTRFSDTLTFSDTRKVGSGKATLTDAGAGAIIGYKTVQITNKDTEGDLAVGKIAAGTETANYSLAVSYAEDASFSRTRSSSENESASGTLTVTGKEGQGVAVSGDIEGFSTMTLKYVTQEEDREIDAWAETEKDTEKFTASKKGDNAAVTYTDNYSVSKTAQGTLTADNSDLARLEGLKTLTVTKSGFDYADAMNYTETYSEKLTGFADEITVDMSLADVDFSLSHTDEVTYKKTWTSVGTATLTDADAAGADVTGYKTVKIVRKDAESVYGNVVAGNESKDGSVKRTFDVDKSATYDHSEKTTYTAAGSLTATGKKDSEVEIGNIKQFTSVDLKYADVAGVGLFENTSSTSSTKISVKAQGDRNAFTKSGNSTDVKTAVGSLTAANSTVGVIDGVKTVTLTDSEFTSADATNTKTTTTMSQNGFTADEISPDITGAVLDMDENYSTQSTYKDEKSVGGANLKFGGKTAGESSVVIKGYSTVSLDNKNSEGVLTASLVNTTSTTDSTDKANFTPDKSYSSNSRYSYTEKAAGSAAIKGYTSANVSGFASVKATGSDYETELTGVDGVATLSDVSTWTRNDKAAGSSIKADYTDSETYSRKVGSTLEASKAALSGSFTALKSVKLTNVNLSGADFSNSRDKNETETTNVKWDADELNEAVPAFGDEKITSYSHTENETKTVVGDFTLKNDKNSAIEGLSISNFKNVDITLASEDTLAVDVLSVGEDETARESTKYTANASKQTLDYSESEKSTSVGSLKVTGKSTTAAVTTLDVAAGDLGFATITLKDAIIIGDAASASAYVENFNYTISQSTSEDGSSSVKVNRTRSVTGNGKFTASIAKPVEDVPVMVFGGTLEGYGNISLSNVSIGNVDNYKWTGAGGYVVPVRGEYFDVFDYNEVPGDDLPDGAVTLYGNLSGSYTVDKNGQINSNWKATSSDTASGSFTQEAKNAGAVAGIISGYDKVTITGVATVGGIYGGNEQDSTTVTYKTAKDEVVTDTTVWSETETSSNSVKITGKKIGSEMQKVTVGGISGYKSVTLDNASVGAVEADDSKHVTTTDNVKEVTTWETTRTANGTLTATDSAITGYVNGFKTVKLTDTEAAVNFNGTSVTRVDVSNRPYPTSYDSKVAGSFTAEYTGKDPAGLAVGNVTGYQQVKLADYSAGNVAAGATLGEEGSFVNSWKVTLGDEKKDTPDVIKASAATKSNTFTAAAKVNTAMTVGSVSFYGKVEASNLESIGSVVNAGRADGLSFEKRKYSATHYGEGNVTANWKDEVTTITAMNVDATSASVTISGTPAKGKTEAKLTAVTGSILGYGSVTLTNVVVGGEAPVAFAGGKFAYTSKTTKDDEFVVQTTSTATGKLSISSAKAAEGASFSVEGYKDVSINLTAKDSAAATFTNIVGGVETAQLTDGDLDYQGYAVSGSLDLATVGGFAEYVAGFQTVALKDTNVGNLSAYAIEVTKDGDGWKREFVAKADVTFDNTLEDASVINQVQRAKSVTFKSSKSDADTDFLIGALITADDADLNVLIDKCQTLMDLQNFSLDKGDVINLSSTGKDGDGTWATIALDGLTEDTLATYFDTVKGTEFTGKGTIMAAVSAEDFTAAIKDKVKVGSNIAFESTLA